MADMVFIPRELIVDLTEFGFGVRTVRVLSGGGGLQPAPHSVGHEEMQENAVGSDNIIDGAVEMDDLNQEVKDKLHHSYDPSDEGIKLGGI